MQPLTIRIKDTVLALDRTTGQELWRTPLMGMSFVNVTLAGEQVLATTRGEIYCLDMAGTILWHNRLKGLGHGLVTIATEAGSIQAAVCAENLQQDGQIAAGAAAAGGAGAC
jgi:PQQ-like domain